MRLLGRIMPPRSYCSVCGRAFYSDRRFKCPCGATARTFDRTATESITRQDKAN